MSNTDKQKAKAVELFKKGTTKADIARQLSVSPRTVGRWVASESAPATKPAAKVANKPKAVKQAKQAPVVEETDDLSFSISVLATRKSISLTKIDTETGSVVDSVVINTDADNFKEIFDLVASSRLDQKILNKAYALCNPKLMVEELSSNRIKVNIKQGTITYTPVDGKPFEVSSRLSKRIINTLRKDGVKGADSILNFLNRLMLNPSNRAVNELYGFLEHNDIALTENGTFYAWKVVRSTYMDKHSNTMLNAVGMDVRVNRNQVDENSEVTCSHGLHVCAKQYISSFYSGGDRIVKVEVNPADVVAIPKDYNDSKMRCCGYKVVEDVTDSFYPQK